MRAVPLLLGLTLWAAGIEPPVGLHLSVPSPLIRPGLPLAFTVQGEPQTDVRFPATLRWRILVGKRVTAAGEQRLDDPSQILAGVRLVAFPGEDPGPGTLEAALIGAGSSGMMPATATPLDSVAAFAVRIQAVRGQANDPAARLRDEQLGEWLATWPTPTLGDLEAVTALLGKAPDSAGVFLDPVDASVQPLRRHPGPGNAWAVVLRPSPGVLKRRWPELPPGAVQAAGQAGLGLVELYPAGDSTFTGINQHRLELATANLDHPLLVAVGAAQAGALAAFHAHPDTWRGVVLCAEDADLTRVETWTSVTRPAGTVEPPPPLAGYAAGPFVVVVGTGEHDAAATDNARLADEFIAAWAIHAHGLPPRIDDAQWRAEDWPHHRLVLIGSPRSNRVLTDLAPRLPAAWNDRGVLLGGIARTRQPPTFCALAVTDPRSFDRTLVMIDGTWPARWESGLPLAQAGSASAVLLPALPPPVAPPAKQP